MAHRFSDFPLTRRRGTFGYLLGQHQHPGQVRRLIETNPNAGYPCPRRFADKRDSTASHAQVVPLHQVNSEPTAIEVDQGSHSPGMNHRLLIRITDLGPRRGLQGRGER
ncbi:MAG TPA: hypothetical protein VLJ88_01500 [Propionibacteriaceae bacterium]|nr:hypothetical protein [Propionibacteriaceae bacterium]